MRHLKRWTVLTLITPMTNGRWPYEGGGWDAAKIAFRMRRGSRSARQYPHLLPSKGPSESSAAWHPLDARIYGGVRRGQGSSCTKNCQERHRRGYMALAVHQILRRM